MQRESNDPEDSGEGKCVFRVGKNKWNKMTCKPNIITCKIYVQK